MTSTARDRGEPRFIRSARLVGPAWIEWATSERSWMNPQMRCDLNAEKDRLGTPVLRPADVRQAARVAPGGQAEACPSVIVHWAAAVAGRRVGRIQAANDLARFLADPCGSRQDLYSKIASHAGF